MNGNVSIYCRDVNGQTIDFDDLEEALRNFMSYEGYRISFQVNDFAVHVHREPLPKLYPEKPNSDDIMLRHYEAKILTFTRQQDN